MKPLALLRIATLGLGLVALSGCAALTSIGAASKVLDAYELSPLTATSTTRARGHLEVETPTASGAIATDRIAVKPGALQVQYLPDARWVDDAPAHVQLLLVRSLANSGRFSLVSRQGEGPDADFSLLTDLQEFTAVVGNTTDVQITLTSTLIRSDDQRIIASRTFQRSVTAASQDTPDIVAAFDSGMTAVLQEIVDWAGRTAR